MNYQQPNGTHPQYSNVPPQNGYPNYPGQYAQPGQAMPQYAQYTHQNVQYQPQQMYQQYYTTPQAAQIPHSNPPLNATPQYQQPYMSANQHQNVQMYNQNGYVDAGWEQQQWQPAASQMAQTASPQMRQVHGLQQHHNHTHHQNPFPQQLQQVQVQIPPSPQIPSPRVHHIPSPQMTHPQYTNHQRIDNMPQLHSNSQRHPPTPSQHHVQPPQPQRPSVPTPQVVNRKAAASMLPPYHSPNLNTAPPKATVAPSKPATAPPKPKPKPKPAAKPPVVYDGPKVDYDMLMLALSDEYIEAAYKLGPTIATSGDDTPSETLETYHNHIAAGLSCLEATLKNFKLAPRMEAVIILRYASLMYDETENYDHMESILSKGLTVCERSKLYDLKFSMHHLLARVTFQTNPRAALKSLDTAIQEVEMYGNSPWAYALRFLRVSLSLQTNSHHDIIVAIQNLKAICVHAEKNDDKAIYITCLTIEAQVHLHSESVDSIISAQEAIARARSLQTHPSASQIPQVWALLNCVDLTCALVQFKAQEAADKMKIVQELMDDLIVEKKSWKADGSISVPLGKASTNRVTDVAAQIYTQDEDGTISLQFTWMKNVDAYALAFLLSGSTTILKNPLESKAEMYVQEGIKVIEEFLSTQSWLSKSSTSSKVDIERQLEQTHILYFYLELYQAIICCIHSKWVPARQMLSKLEEKLVSDTFHYSSNLSRWIMYLQGVVEQGCANTETAREIFQRILSQQISKVTMASKRSGSVSDDISILSRLNLLFILRDPENPPSPESESILQDLMAMDATKHPNPAIRSAMGLITAMINPREAITKKKAALQQALTGSRAINNGQLLAVTMAAMVGMFFTDIVVGDQARKSRHTARVLAKKAENPLWISVADGLALQGEHDPNEQYVLWQEIERNMDKLDDTVQKRFSNA